MSPRRPPRTLEALLARLGSDDAEARWEAAGDLATRGDRRAIAPLERLALTDDDCFQREGAYVDTTQWPYVAALGALREVYARHPASPDDVRRVTRHLADLAQPRAEALAATLGTAAREAAAPLRAHPDPRVRLRAHNVAAQASGEPANSALSADDEAVRLAATQQDAYRGDLVHDALTRFPDEPSAVVRRGICDLWLRYRARMGGWLHASTLALLLADPDPAIHAPVAREVLARARARAGSGEWMYDPGRLGPVRDRLAALLAATPGLAHADLLREALALVEARFAPFERGAARAAATAPPAGATPAAAPDAPPAEAAPAPAPDDAAPAPPSAPPDAAEAAEEGWSVREEPALAADVRAAVRALGPDARRSLATAIGVKVTDELAQMIAPWFSPGVRDHARVDVYGARLRPRHRAYPAALVLYFIADHDNYNHAQSGSDWDDHYLFAGHAVVVKRRLREVTFALERHVHLTEHEHEGYDARAIRDLVRAELRARFVGAAADRAPFEAEIARVHAASEARARAANARAPAAPAPAPAPVAPDDATAPGGAAALAPGTLRCPTCGSTKVNTELLFDNYKLACEACQRWEMFETYPERDSDDHWYA